MAPMVKINYRHHARRAHKRAEAELAEGWLFEFRRT
jgi:hypothetical protein